MIRDLDKAWLHRATTCPFIPSAVITDAGLIPGAGTVLARMRSAHARACHRDGGALDFEGDHDRLIALLEVATHGRVPMHMTSHLEAAAKFWGQGDKALAHIRLAYARIPPLAGCDDAYRLFLAELLLEAGLAPHDLMKELALPHRVCFNI